MNDRLEKLLSKLDFEKIHAYMLLTNWTYGWSNPCVPSIAELQETARDLLQTVMASEDASTRSATGGFSAMKFTWDGQVYYEIMFAIEDANEV